MKQWWCMVEVAAFLFHLQMSAATRVCSEINLNHAPKRVREEQERVENSGTSAKYKAYALFELGRRIDTSRPTVCSDVTIVFFLMVEYYGATIMLYDPIAALNCTKPYVETTASD